jgi:hypothetical protein
MDRCPFFWKALVKSMIVFMTAVALDDDFMARISPHDQANFFRPLTQIYDEAPPDEWPAALAILGQLAKQNGCRFVIPATRRNICDHLISSGQRALLTTLVTLNREGIYPTTAGLVRETVWDEPLRVRTAMARAVNDLIRRELIFNDAVPDAPKMLHAAASVCRWCGMSWEL